jgi:hypothetical protein
MLKALVVFEHVIITPSTLPLPQQMQNIFFSFMDLRV